MKIIKVQFKSKEHRKAFAEVAEYNYVFAKFMPDVFLAKYDPKKLVGFMLVDVNGEKIQLPESERGGGIIFDEEEFDLFMEEIK